MDTYTMIEFNRLCYIFLNQKNLWAKYYDKISAPAKRGEDDLSEQGKNDIYSFLLHMEKDIWSSFI